MVSISAWLEGQLPGSPVAPPAMLDWPLSETELDDLRWYLEDYLPAPFGVYSERGSQIADRLPGWGQAIFEALFGAGPARDAWVGLRAANRPVQVLIRSSVPAVLGLPWELLRDPRRITPLVLDGVALNRSLPAEGTARAFAVGGQRLRVLMVISRPAGRADVSYRMIARPLLQRLAAVRGDVDLVVLRPPTLENLVTELAAAKAVGQPFQIVHFDGHGVLAGRRAARVAPGSPGSPGSPLHFAASESGVLVFEKPTGGPDQVPAGDLAQVLSHAEVPVVVLNACQSGAVGKQLEAAVATRLLQDGAASVVAMAYTVYAVAAAEFMTAFYEALFTGETVSAAVEAGRRRLARNDERPSPKGQMPLADWVIPVHYLRSEVRFSQLKPTLEPVALDLALDEIRERGATRDSLEELAPINEFVGRDGLFFDLEVALRHQRVVVLHGPGGTGKTELAKAFGRWWQDTGGVEKPHWVIWHSFEPGVASFGLDGVLASIGLRIYGPNFARLDRDERKAEVWKLFAATDCC